MVALILGLIGLWIGWHVGKAIWWCIATLMVLLLCGCTTSSADLVKALSQDQARTCAAAEITLPWGTTHAVVCRDNSPLGSTLTADEKGTLSMQSTSTVATHTTTVSP